MVNFYKQTKKAWVYTFPYTIIVQVRETSP